MVLCFPCYIPWSLNHFPLYYISPMTTNWIRSLQHGQSKHALIQIWWGTGLFSGCTWISVADSHCESLALFWNSVRDVWSYRNSFCSGISDSFSTNRSSVFLSFTFSICFKMLFQKHLSFSFIFIILDLVQKCSRLFFFFLKGLSSRNYWYFKAIGDLFTNSCMI